jgi:hypothetical protein
MPAATTTKGIAPPGATSSWRSVPTTSSTGPLHHRPAIGRLPEGIREQQGAQRDLDIVVAVAHRLADALDLVRVRILGDELAPELGGDERRGLRTLEDHVEHGVAVEAARFAEHRLHAGIVDERAEQVAAGFAIEAPARERARRFLDVAFRVLPLAEREELHHLAREVLVRLRLAALRGVEVDEHRRVLRRRVQEVGEAAERVRAQRYVLLVHEPRETHLLLARHEVVVPEERHALGDGRWRHQHLVHPPGAKLETLAHELLLEYTPLLGRQGVRARIAQRSRFQRECRCGRDRLRANVAQDQVDALLARERGVTADLGVGGTEPRAGEEVARLVEAHRRGRPGHRQDGDCNTEDSPQGSVCSHGRSVQRASLRAC